MASLTRTIIGWREWLNLPDLGIPRIKAKIDTGARSSCLHAFNVKRVRRGGKPYIRFDVHPLQRDDDSIINCVAPLIEFRTIKSSNGKRELRPVVKTTIVLDNQERTIELTLSSRDEMGFRMLIGREAIRGKFIVDPGSSYLTRDVDAKKKKTKTTAKKVTKKTSRPERPK